VRNITASQFSTIAKSMEEDHFRLPGAPKTLNRFTWNLACLVT